VDVGASGWDCTLEPDAASTGGLALRLGLRQVAGIGREEGERVAALRAGPAALARAGIGRRTIEALAGADAFRSLGLDRRRALWEAAAVERAAPAPLPLFEGIEAAPRLPVERRGEATVLDYGATNLSLRAHPLALLRPRLDALRCADSRGVTAARQGQRLRTAGIVLVRQRPGTAKGVVFFTLEDEFGTVNLVLHKGVIEKHRAPVVAARLLLVEGRGRAVRCGRGADRAPAGLAAGGPVRPAGRAGHGGGARARAARAGGRGCPRGAPRSPPGGPARPAGSRDWH
jgi:error-prone DNA polymerase